MASRLVDKKPFVPSLPTAVARCGVARVLRPWLKRPAISLVAALVVPNAENMEFYSAAVDGLLSDTVATQSFEERSLLVKVVLNSTDIDASGVARWLRQHRRVVMLFPDIDDIPGWLSMTTDVVGVIEPPPATHFVAAARFIGRPGMTIDEARFLGGETFERIKIAFRTGRSIQNSLRRLRLNPEAPNVADEKKPETPDRKHPRLEDLAGYGEAKDWGLDLALDLAEWEAGRAKWEDVDRGALLSGPPGCGKTSYAAALGQTCGIPVLFASAAKWQGMGHLGDMLKAMRKSFDDAKKEVPSILFIDEFDSFGDRNIGDPDSMEYRRQVINGLLECLDGREGVVVVGATNYPQKIDPALLRPGRLDRHLRIPLPDASARRSILRHHLGGELACSDFSEFVKFSMGFTGADIEKVARDARRTARRAGRSLSMPDLLAAMPERTTLSPEFQRSVAVHEAGHALVGILIGRLPLVALSIEETFLAEGGRQTLGGARFDVEPVSRRTRSYYLDRIAMLMGGIAAEEIVYGSFSDGAGGNESSDLHSATNLATQLECQLGMGRSLVSEAGDSDVRLEEIRVRSPILWNRIDVILREQADRAKQLSRITNPRCTG